ncbi:MAG: ArsR/SmtB family transcription factor [Niveispirillum sp.]|uniref:ArsR/SmtB family transcription factor n=1 Tax=Niveispirillum sp. TaxID=1917217 RepID=UPI003BA61BE2
MEEMQANADRAVELLKSLGNRSRLMILCQLLQGERSVGDLAQRIGMRDTAVSQQLALLRKDGLVRARREGQTIWYALASAEAERVILTLYQVYCADPGPAECG